MKIRWWGWLGIALALLGVAIFEDYEIPKMACLLSAAWMIWITARI